MTRDRIVQFIAAFTLVLAFVGAGFMIPSMIEDQDEYELKYTAVSVEGAPPFVALSSGIGALRGVLVNYLWIKITVMKERGQFYEIMADSELLTKLQPRFGKVWTFHGHNMAYNVSVATHTQQERWEWVRAGLRLVQNEGLRYNPNDLELYRELAWWYQHKIDGYSDDAHLYYKTELCREWHELLGKPPVRPQDRIVWLQPIIDAPDSLDEVIVEYPAVQDILDALTEDMGQVARQTQFKLDSKFLREYGRWQDITQFSTIAEMFGIAEQERQSNPRFRSFDEVAGREEWQEEWAALIAFTRKKVLAEEYNMDPAVMQRYTDEWGNLDWRHAQSHAFYWSRLGTEMAETRAWNDDKIYKVMNNDRMQMHAMQSLARTGYIVYDPFSNELPSRLPDPSWVDTIDRTFEDLYFKHIDTRGAGGETFIAFIENFMKLAIVQAYRSGEIQRAQDLLDNMDQRFGRAAGRPDNFYNRPLEVFVQDVVKDQYQNQPHLAQQEVNATFRRAFREAVGRDNEDKWESALEFADMVTNYMRDRDGNYGHVNKFGRGRLAELVAGLETSKRVTFLQVMVDDTISLAERATIWATVDKYDNKLRGQVFRRIRPTLAEHLARSPFGINRTVEDIFPPPPNLNEIERALAAEEAALQRRVQEAREGRGEIVTDQ